MKERCLPFPRGRTYSQTGGDIGELSMDDSKFSGWEGRIFEVDDTEHGTGETVKLRCVKNDTGGAITVARLLYQFSTNALDFGRRISSVAADGGDVCKPLDDAYVVGFTIPDDDLLWVVESGPCSVLVENDTIGVAAHDAVQATTGGKIDKDAAAAGSYVVGQADILPVKDTNLVVHVNEGLANANA